MWPLEWRLQMGGLRSWLVAGSLVCGDVILNLFLQGLAHGGIVSLRGFDLLRSDHRFVLGILLSALFMAESLHWIGQGFRDGTFQLGIFAGLARWKLLGVRLSVIGIRAGTVWLSVFSLSILFVLLVDGGQYPLLDEVLSRQAQLSRFSLAALQDLAASLMWIGIASAILISLRGKRFESSFLAWVLFCLLQIVPGETQGEGAFGTLGAAANILFEQIAIENRLGGLIVAGYVVPLSIGSLGAVLSLHRFDRLNILPPQMDR